MLLLLWVVGRAELRLLRLPEFLGRFGEALALGDGAESSSSALPRDDGLRLGDEHASMVVRGVRLLDLCSGVAAARDRLVLIRNRGLCRESVPLSARRDRQRRLVSRRLGERKERRIRGMAATQGRLIRHVRKHFWNGFGS